jgi:tetratricopeptide (TPR) repeat protein
MKDLAGAITECDTVLAAEPKWIVDILKIKASSALELGNIEQARATYRQALALRNDLVWARLGLARCDQAAGQLDQAKKLVSEVLETNVQFVGAYDLLAQIAEAQGNEEEVLDAFNKSYEVIPSARRSRLMGDAAYRVGNLEQARQAFSKALSHTRGSLTAQASDALSLAQVQVDIGDAADALSVLSAAAQEHQDDPYFAARQATIAAQAFARLGDMNSAQAAFASAKELADGIRADIHTLTLAKAAFCVGLDEEGARIVAKAIKADHENTRLVAFARRVLQDTGNEALIEKVVDESISAGALIVEQATQLMRAGQFDESLAKLEEALTATPENTGVLLAAAQLHLLWMSQKGLDRNYVERVNGYLSQLDVLMPNSERVAKMYRFLRETLVKASVET